MKKMEAKAVERAEKAIRRALGSKWANIPFRMLDETDSTNLRLKEEYRAGQLTPPFLLTADSQTTGRGRLGRSFVSPPGTGLYMSLLSAPPPGADCGLITVLAAVAVCGAIEEMTALQPKIKWVNDLFLRGKKVCGILAETAGERVIVGIGVNLAPAPLPPELEGTVGFLDCGDVRERLAAEIARGLLRRNAEDRAFLTA